ncbi:MAG TPA: hypothetical protein VI260_25565 [Blastocatellia bacterium]|jgi:hypothetical protein
MSRRNKSGDIGPAADDADRFPLFAAEIRGEGEAERLPLFADEVRGEQGREAENLLLRETQSSGVESAGKEKKTMQQQQELSPFAKVKFIALKEAYPNLSEEEITEIAIEAAEAAREMFGQMMEAGADPWVVREQILHDLSQA